MIKLLVRFAIVVLLAFAFTWMADQPGQMSVTWLGYQIDEIPIYLVVGLFLLLFFALWFVWWLIRLVFGTPGAVGDFFRLRRNRKGIDALSKGMVAVSAGDAVTAKKQALLAKKLVADSPLAHLLEAQAAQLRGDNSRVTQIYNDMLSEPETELVALRGLYVAARKEGDDDAARRYAEKAHRRDNSLAWSSHAVAGYLSNDEDWPGVAAQIDSQRRAGVIDRDEANVKRAVVMTVQAMAVQDSDADAAIDLAVKAHKLDPGLIPAAVVAGTTLAAHGSLRRASKILEKTWKLNPHPDIADAYVHSRMGDSAQDRLHRVKDLLRVSAGGVEGALALAHTAIDARDWTAARNALEASASDGPTARVCLLMAEIEEGEFGDKGRAREWLAKAARAPRDPAWTADGYVSQKWQPVSPVSGELGAFAWKAPVTLIGHIADEPEADLGMQAIVIEEPDKEPDEMAEAVTDEVAGEAEVVEAEPVKDEQVVQEASEAVEDDGEPTEIETAEESTETEDAAAESTEQQAVPDEALPEATEADDVQAAGVKGSDDSEDISDMRQPDDPGPRKETSGNSRKSWFG